MPQTTRKRVAKKKAAKKAAPAAKRARRTRVAAATATGKSVSAIAREEQISRTTVHADLAHPETQAVIAALVDGEVGLVRELFQSALDVLHGAMQANKEYSHGGGTFAGGPDHFARITAVKTFVDLLKAGRPAPKAPDEAKDRPLTLDDIRRLVAAASAPAAAPKEPAK